MAQDSSVKLQVGPPKRGEDSKHSKESPRPGLVSSYADNLNPHSDDTHTGSQDIVTILT